MKTPDFGKSGLPVLLVVFVLPFIVIFSLLLREINTNVHATRQRISGLEYEQPLMKLLQHVLQYRNAANARLSAAGVSDRSLAELRLSIDRDIGDVDRVDGEHGAALRTTAKWAKLKARWAAIKRRSQNVQPQEFTRLFDPRESQVTAFVHDPAPNATSLTSLIADVSDVSGLVLESQLDTHYLIDTGITRLPTVAMEIANVSDVGQLILARGSQSITNEEIRELSLRVGTIKRVQSTLGRRMEVAVGYNPGLRRDLAAFRSAQSTAQDLVDLTTAQFIDAFIISIPPQRFHGASRAALDAQFDFYDTLSSDARALMLAQLAGWQGKRRFVVVFAALVLMTTVSGFALFYRSLSARQQAEASLRDTEELNRLIVENALDAVIGMDDRGRITEWNPRAAAIFGWSSEEAVGRPLSDTIVPLRYRAAHEQGLERFKETGQGRVFNQRLELAGLHHDGHEFPIELIISLVRGGGKCLFSAFVSDITERKRAEEQLQQSALFDALTGLPNRTLFMDRLSHVFKRAMRNPESRFAVLFIDLDHFKVVNDSMGHTVGDQLLVAVARRLETCLRPTDTVARLGGDEFTVLLEDTEDAEGLSVAIHVAERIQQTLAQPFTLNERPVFIAASIGIAGGQPNLADLADEAVHDGLEALLRDADTAMYRAKASGRAGYAIFDTAMHEQAVARLHLEADLRQALERREFELHYQPVMRLEDRRVVGFEALVRWRHPERGLISPALFIPVAEETALVVQIDRWVLRAACEQLAAWQKAFPTDPPLTMSVNLSGRNFARPDLIEHVAAVLRETETQPFSVKLEITESAIVDNPQSAASSLQQLQATGAGLSLDDFGTGYSSLSYLHRFPFNTLKIDRSFVWDMSHSDAGEIVRTIVLLAHNLNLDVVAEGIETEEQAARLALLNCEYGQGFLFSKPLDGPAAQALLSTVSVAV